MEKNMIARKKKWILVCFLFLVLAIIAVTVIIFTKVKGYRTIQVYEVQGKAYVERDGDKTFDAYENLNLLSGDLLGTQIESWTRLKMDEDKYVLVEPESKLDIVAVGSEKNSRTNIELKTGAVTVEIQNKLGSGSSYQITTPNSVMAVRGTVFRVAVEWDEKGKPITRLTTFEGEVSVKKVNQDGSLSDETMVDKGKEAIIYQNDEEVYLEILEEIDYDNLPTKVLETLVAVITDHGRELWETASDISDVITARNEAGQESEDISGQETDEKPKKDRGQRSQPEEKKSQTEDLENSQSENAPSSSEQSENAEQAEENKTYKVTFLYKGKLFGEQEVEEKETVQKPKLKPAQTGKWDFDFSTPIQKDTVIVYKD